MSKEHYFRIISNTWQDTELLPDHVTIKDKKFLLAFTVKMKELEHGINPLEIEKSNPLEITA